MAHNVALFRSAGSDEDFRACQQGTAVLTTEAQCTAYLAAYGDMHRIKLESAYAQFFSTVGSLSNASLEIIDWGCGQGLASGVLIDYLREQSLPLSISRVTLIEPSKLALSRAVDHLSVLMEEERIAVRTINQNADVLTSMSLTTDAEAIKIHLFSNLLDMNEVDYTAIARTINSSQAGKNWFVCVSPTINQYRDKRLGAFRSQFGSANTLSERTDSLSGSIYRVLAKRHMIQLVFRNECLFTVQL